MNKSFKMRINYPRAGADLGGWRTPLPFRDSTPCQPKPKGPPFDTFSEIQLWPTDPKIFLKAPLAPIYTNFEGERAPKKNTIFLSTFFKKCPKTAFLAVFSENCLQRRKFCQNRGKTVLWESSKNQFGRPKKKGHQNLWKFFWKSAPPLEKILDPPLSQSMAKLPIFKLPNLCKRLSEVRHLLEFLFQGVHIFKKA